MPTHALRHLHHLRHHLAGLGENGALVYNTRKKYRFADAALVHTPNQVPGRVA